MKKLVLALLVVAAMTIGTPAFAFTLNLGENQFHFADYDMGTNWAPNGNGGFVALNWKNGTPTLSDNQEDSWGVASVSDITIPPLHDPANPTSRIWNAVSTGESLEAHFYGLDDVNVTAATVGSVNIVGVDSAAMSTGAFVDLYLDTTGEYGIPTNPYVEGNYPADAGLIINGGTHNVGDVTDGEKILSLEFVPFYGNGVVYENSYGFNASTGQFTHGSGAGYLKVVGGTLAPYFDSNFFNSFYPGADVYFTTQFDVNAPVSNWTVKTKGIATANVIPEPASMMLFGSGILSMLGFGLRKKEA